MIRIKEMLHCLQLDSRIRHNIKYAQREWFFSYFKHFRKDLNMPLLNSIKQEEYRKLFWKEGTCKTLYMIL